MSWEDKAIERLGKANANIADMKQDIISRAANAQYLKPTQTFWERQKIFLWISGFLLLCAYGLYLIGSWFFWFFGLTGGMVVYTIMKTELHFRKMSRNTPPKQNK